MRLRTPAIRRDRPTVQGSPAKRRPAQRPRVWCQLNFPQRTIGVMLRTTRARASIWSRTPHHTLGRHHLRLGLLGRAHDHAPALRRPPLVVRLPSNRRLRVEAPPAPRRSDLRSHRALTASPTDPSARRPTIAPSVAPSSAATGSGLRAASATTLPSPGDALENLRPRNAEGLSRRGRRQRPPLDLHSEAQWAARALGITPLSPAAGHAAPATGEQSPGAVV